ncbi:hypothetical protein A3L04_07230 [Thermococcus chitonophagus]|uniref:Motif=EF-hand calcium-binding domain n=1 Tax=Thermococcus chitonophagus TaxID=54262 RepID=A0A160VTS8_9EURY|nr:prenyltransferase/squalene oxidase repeat-containing protein [Thermococcus chitonophagus]ASJ16880.1 hypothetical protein A3L04_07230 [Thermococcus chitonophagus]CUX78360.1 motif=EF-hand calcium-binding domain [Thermococcus chitonophagus]
MKRPVVLMLLLLIIAAPVSAVDMLDISSKIVKTYPDEGETKTLSLIVMALSQALNKTPSLTPDDVWNRVEELLSWQNSDGGWGYFYGSVSSVPDTSYALIALSKAIKVFGDVKKKEKIRIAIIRGVSYLEKAFNKDGWGYLPGMRPDYRSTLLASAALVMLNEDLYLVKKAYPMLKDKIPDDPYLTYLWIVITSKIEGGIPNEALNKLQGNEAKLALKAYALLELKGLDFQTALILADLEKYKDNWTNKYYPIYATMAFSMVSERVINPTEDKLKATCSVLESSQNPDGGWGVYVGSPSSPSVTYFVLDSLKICNPMSPASKKGLEYMRKIYESEEEKVMVDQYLTQRYLFALLALLEYKNLTNIEKEKAKSLIMSTFWGDMFGKQPLTTALAIKALIMLGVPKTEKIIQENIKWLLSMKKNGGWGFTFETFLNKWYFAPLYPETTIILGILKDFVPKEQLADVISYVETNPPDQAWEVLYIYSILKSMGIEPKLNVCIESPGKSPLYDAFLVRYYSINPEVPRVNLYTVLSNLKNSSVELRSFDAGMARVIADGMKDILYTNVSVKLTKLPEVPEYGNYVLVYPVTVNVDISRYNSDVVITTSTSGYPVINGMPVYGDGVLLIVPGRNRNGELLFVLYAGKGYKDIANLIFNSPILKYLHGKAVIASWVDENRDGRVEIDELNVRFL